MSGFDIFVLVLIGGAAILGFLRGFVQEALSLIAWVLVIVGVRTLHTPITDRLIAPIGSEGGASVLAFAAIVIVTYALGRWNCQINWGQVTQVPVGPNRPGSGFGFGMIKGLIAATLIYLLAVMVYDTVYGADAKRPIWLQESRTYPLLNASGKAMVEFVEERRAELPEEEASEE